MDLHAIGLNIRHTGDFRIDRPYGSGDNLFIVFKTNAYLEIGGEEFHVLPNTCILYPKDVKQCYRTTGNTYVNHYLHFDIDKAMPLPPSVTFNTPILLTHVSEVEEILKMLSREQISTSENKERNIELLIHLLLFKISDNALFSSTQQNNSQHHEMLTDLRADIYCNAGQYRSINDLAQKVNLSMSHFQSLYHSQFGISCYDDLLTAKTMNAQHHLSNTNLTVKEIALLCGYENDTCFMRSFKKRTGLTPTQYRNSLKNT